MKKVNFSKFIIIVLFYFFSLTAFGQLTEPGDPGGDPVGEDPLGGGAPVGSGTLLLLTLGAAYGSKKIINQKKSKNN